MLIILILINIKIVARVLMTREDILNLCHSNPELIVDHIESLESELNDAK